MQPVPSTSGGKHMFNALTTQKSSQNLWPIFKKKSRQQKSFKVQLRDQSGNVKAHASKENVEPYYEQLKENQVEDYIPDCEHVVEVTGDETEHEDDNQTDVFKGICESTYEDRGDKPRTNDENKTDESPFPKEEDTSDCDTEVILNKQARKGAKRCIESEGEASSDDDTIIYDCSESFRLKTTLEPSCAVGDLNDLEDVQSPRKKKKYSRIQAPVESSLETENSVYDDDEEDNTTSQTSNSTDSSESDTESDCSTYEPVVDEFDDFRDDILYRHVRGYIYYMVMKANGQEEEVKLLPDTMKSVQFVEDKIWAMKNIGESDAWNHTFKKYLKSIPYYEGSPDGAEELGDLTDCQACNRPEHPWAYRVVMKGYPYDGKTFEVTDVADPAKFMVGKFCYHRSKLYHKLYHWPYHLYRKYERKLEEMDNNPDRVMRKKQTVLRYYQQLKSVLHKVEQDYMDEGRRCNKRWERANKNY